MNWKHHEIANQLYNIARQDNEVTEDEKESFLIGALWVLAWQDKQTGKAVMPKDVEW